MIKRLIKLTLASTVVAAFITPVSFNSSAFASSSQARTPSAARLSGSNIVSTALSYVGSRYAYSGDTPATGFSCTGFVHWVYSQYGYNTPEDVGTLYYSFTHVSGDLQPGDVLLFANTFHAGLSHAAIYIGGGQMVGADNFSVGVHVDNVYDGYWGPRYVGAVRIASDSAPVQQVAAYHYSQPATTTYASYTRSRAYTTYYNRAAYTPVTYYSRPSYTYTTYYNRAPYTYYRGSTSGRYWYSSR